VTLERKETDLWPVPVGDDEFVFERNGGEFVTRDGDVPPLVLIRQLLPTAEQSVPAQGDDHPHGWCPFGMTDTEARMALIAARLG